MKNMYDLIIIGAGPSGLSAAIYAGRAKLRTLVVEKSEIGGQIKITSEVVNYPGVLKTSGAALTAEMRKQAENFGVTFLNTEISEVELDKDIKVLKTKNGEELSAVSVLIATGARPRFLGFKGEKEFAGRGVAYCATCDGEFFTGLEVFVIGGGFAATEEAMFLTRFARKVTVMVREEEFTCSKTIADKVLAHEKIEVHFNTEILELTGEEVPKKARFKNNKTGEVWEYEAKESDGTFGTFIFAGYEPSSDLYKTYVETDERGYIKTDEHMNTNISGVFAAGDIRPKRLRQLVTAVSDGAVAATSIEKYAEEKKEELGITIESVEAKVIHEAEEKAEVKEEAGSSDEFFDAATIAGLKPIFEKFESKLKLVVITKEDSKLSDGIVGFAKDFVALTDKVSLDIYKENENLELQNKISAKEYPLIAIFKEDGSYSGITYHGIPGGHEFNSFILALYNTSGPGQALEEDMKIKIAEVQEKTDIQVFISLSCTMCPDLVAATQRIAAENKNISAAMLDLAHYPEIKAKHNIMSVPAMIINGGKVHFGKKDMNNVLELIKNG